MALLHLTTDHPLDRRAAEPPRRAVQRRASLAGCLRRAALLLMWCACAALLAPLRAQAATAEEEARMKQCPEGQYLGPGTGSRRFYQDPYIWFVSREFARRFCMPESYVDDTLKGALALAVRLKPEEFVLCGLFMGRSDQCPLKQRLLMDVYVDNTRANIPKADPSVRFFVERPHSSGWLVGPEGRRDEYRRRGEMPDVEGERRPFSPAHSKTVNEKTWTRFLYLGVRNGWATDSGSFVETYYRADWVPGIDLITLYPYLMGFQGLRNPDEKVQTERRGGRGYHDEEHDKTDPIQRWAIGVMRSDEYFAWKMNNTKPAFPSSYLHVIDVPHRVAQMIYRYDWQQGAQFFESVRRAMQPAVEPRR